MKTKMIIPLITLAVVTLNLAGRAQDQAPAVEEDTLAVQAPANDDDSDNNTAGQAVNEAIQAVVDSQQANGDNSDEMEAQPANGQSPRPIRGRGTRGTAGSSTNAQALASVVSNASTSGTKNLRLNFRNAPLSLVLDYLSDAAGFTISANSKVDLKGTVTVWSNQPVNRTETIRLLNAALTSSGYAATVEGNLLNIYVLDATNTEILAGVPDNDYTRIPATKDLVTQIAYVNNVEASQLIQSLEPLMPSGTSMKANQGANAIVITDTKANIRRMVQLVKALDTASVSASTVRVFPLEYADATAMAQVVQQVFQTESGNNRGGRGGFGGFPGFGGFGGGNDGGGGGGRGGNNNSSSTQPGRMTSARVLATADDRSNSLVVSAGVDQMALVEQLVRQMDVNVDDVTELRVFRLRYADPTETADQLTNLFPDTTNQRNQRNQQFGFGPFGGGGGGGNNRGNNSDPNSRRLKQTRVTAVPDPRTGSVIVSAARDMMGQIAGIIEELDSDPSKKKKVYVIPVQNRDPQEVVDDLQSVIATDTTSGNFNNNNNRNNNRNTGQLNTRQQNNLQNQGNNNGLGGNFGNNGGIRTTGQ